MPRATLRTDPYLFRKHERARRELSPHALRLVRRRKRETTYDAQLGTVGVVLSRRQTALRECGERGTRIGKARCTREHELLGSAEPKHGLALLGVFPVKR